VGRKRGDHRRLNRGARPVSLTPRSAGRSMTFFTGLPPRCSGTRHPLQGSKRSSRGPANSRPLTIPEVRSTLFRSHQPVTARPAPGRSAPVTSPPATAIATATGRRAITLVKAATTVDPNQYRHRRRRLRNVHRYGASSQGQHDPARRVWVPHRLSQRLTLITNHIRLTSRIGVP
jgi:hypothetical protein